MEEEVRICDCCGMKLAEDEGRYVDEELLCEDCVADYCITCDHCGETIWTTDCVTDDNSFLCQSCFDAHFLFFVEKHWNELQDLALRRQESKF